MRLNKIAFMGILFLSSVVALASSEVVPIEQKYAAETIGWIEGKIHEEHMKNLKNAGASIAAVGMSGAISGASALNERAHNTTTSTSANANPDAGYTYTDSGLKVNLFSHTETVTAITHYGLLGALGGTTSILATGGILGASALAVYVAFKLGKEAADRKACNFACGFDPLEMSIKNARLRSESGKENSERLEKNALVASVSSRHFKNAVDLLNAEKDSLTSSGDLKEKAQRFIHGEKKRSTFKTAGSEIEYIISLFGNSPDYNIYLVSQTAGRCLMKCPVDLSWQFMCKMIQELPDKESVLRLGQMLSASHHNLVSFNTVKNTNLARFLRHTKAHFERDRYGKGTTNRCVEERINTEDNSPPSSDVEKMQTLIDFQLALENHAQLKQNKALLDG